MTNPHIYLPICISYVTPVRDVAECLLIGYILNGRDISDLHKCISAVQCEVDLGVRLPPWRTTRKSSKDADKRSK